MLEQGAAAEPRQTETFDQREASMPFIACQKCGVADNRDCFYAQRRDGQAVWPCPECRRPMVPVTLREALELVRERAEADEWRAGRQPDAAGAR